MDGKSQSRIAPFHIGEIRVEPAGNRIEKDGVTIRLEPMVMRVLVFLAQSPGEVLGKDQILEAVWDHRNVGEEVLTRSISELRRALGDAPKTPRFIETVYKKGYRLLARPATGPSSPELALPEYAAEAHSKPRLNRGAAKLLVAAALIILPALVWLLVRNPDGSQGLTDFGMPTESVKLVPLTTYPGHEYYSPFSPDGKRIALVWEGPEGGHNYDIWIKTLGEETPFQLTHSGESEDYPAWHPEGGHVAFVRGSETGGIFMRPLLGGSERRLFDRQLGSIEGISFSPDGEWLAFSAGGQNGLPHRIYRLSLRTNQWEALTDPGSASIGDFQPRFSPDGNFVLFERVTGKGGDQDLFLVSVPTTSISRPPEPTRLTFDRRYINGKTWLPHGGGLVYASQRGGYSELWELGLNGSTRKLSASLIPIMSPECSADGRYLSFTHKLVEQNIWVQDLRSDESRPRRLVASSHFDLSPVFSPDGERVAFISYRSGYPEIWVCRPDGGNLLRLTHFHGPYLQFPRWSPDGRQLVFDVLQDGNSQLFRISADGGTPILVTPSGNRETLGNWSPDGRALYFSSDRDGSWQIWRRPIEGGQAIQVTHHGGYNSFVNQSRLYFTKFAQLGLWYREAGAEHLLIENFSAENTANWLVRDQYLYYLDFLRAHRVMRRDLTTGETTIIATIKKLGFENQAFSLSPDGGRLIYGQCDSMESDIMMMDLNNKDPNIGS